MSHSSEVLFTKVVASQETTFKMLLMLTGQQSNAQAYLQEPLCLALCNFLAATWMLALLANYLNVSFSDHEAFLPVSSLMGTLLARGRYSIHV